MLKNWTPHAEYQQFIISILSSFYKTFPKRIAELEPSNFKLYCLKLDILGEILKPYYSNTGRPSAEIFRSFSLMLFQKETSITNWVNKFRNDDLLAACIGCASDKTQSLGTHYDFISRLWLSDLSSDRIKLKNCVHLRRNQLKQKRLVKIKNFPINTLILLKRLLTFCAMVVHSLVELKGYFKKFLL